MPGRERVEAVPVSIALVWLSLHGDLLAGDRAWLSELENGLALYIFSRVFRVRYERYWLRLRHQRHSQHVLGKYADCLCSNRNGRLCLGLVHGHCSDFVRCILEKMERHSQREARGHRTRTAVERERGQPNKEKERRGVLAGKRGVNRAIKVRRTFYMCTK